MYKLLVLLALCAAAFAQIPKPCMAPAAFESRLLEIDPTKRWEVRAKLSYDGLGRRERVVDEVHFNDTKDFFDVLRFYNERTEYILNLKTRKCERKGLTREFRPIAVPYNATFYGEAEIGTAGDIGAGVLVNLWGGEEAHGRYFGIWTSRDCLPVSENYYRKDLGYIHASFYDVSLGISDPNIFIPPKECR